MLKVTSIFTSINGECNKQGQGSWATFIRFNGCTANCSYCDTKYSNDPDNVKEMSVQDIYNEVKELGCKNIVLTGGEPLEQKLLELIELINTLCANGYTISIETNGIHLDTIKYLYEEGIRSLWLKDVTYVVDFKLLSAGNHVHYKMDYSTFKELNKDLCMIKFVISDSYDYGFAKKVAEKLEGFKMYFSPAESLKPTKLFAWMNKDKLYNIGFNYQIHKQIWKNNVRDEDN